MGSSRQQRTGALFIQILRSAVFSVGASFIKGHRHIKACLLYTSPLFIFALLSSFVFIDSYPFHQNRLVFVVGLEIVFASTRTIVFTTELNKSAAAPKDVYKRQFPDSAS